MPLSVQMLMSHIYHLQLELKYDNSQLLYSKTRLTWSWAEKNTSSLSKRTGSKQYELIKRSNLSLTYFKS